MPGSKTPLPALSHPVFWPAINTRFLPRPFTHLYGGPWCFVSLVQVDLGPAVNLKISYQWPCRACLTAVCTFTTEFPSTPSCFLLLFIRNCDKLVGSCSLVLPCHAGIEPRTLYAVGKLTVTEPQPWPGSQFLALDPSDSFLFALDFSGC